MSAYDLKPGEFRSMKGPIDSRGPRFNGNRADVPENLYWDRTHVVLMAPFECRVGIAGVRGNKRLIARSVPI
jgi:hypothetical protein